MADASKKRKQTSHPGPGNNPKRARFPMRPQHVIAATPTRDAYPNGELNVKNFLKSHETEIASLENAMRAAKKALSRRAFQEVPRELRRRTASHNPQRVPKRLRMRARQEAKDDNTPIARGTSGSGIGKGKKKYLRREGREKSRQDWEKRARRRKEASSSTAPATRENDQDGDARMEEPPKAIAKPGSNMKPKPKFPPLATPATPPSRFRRRQRDKTWLPTHLWHTKRAKMTDPKDPLWRFAIPLKPVTKAYRLTHRAATQRGAVAWDMSYMSTISLEGLEASILGMLKGLHFGIDDAEDLWQDKGRAKKWRNGTRAWEGWICAREARPPRKIARVTVIWCAPTNSRDKRKVFIRAHPGVFVQLWNEVIRISKVQNPAVTVQDLRFEIGSIEITGPASTETLCSILAPVSSVNTAADAPQSLWPTLASVTDATSLPAGALLAFDVSDPRLDDPPTPTPLAQDQRSLDALTETLAAWPIDKTQNAASIFDTSSRLSAQRTMSSQKSINRRKSICTPGESPEARPTDPRIPTLIFASRESRSWTILLPWKCVMAVWRQMMRYPVSTGGNPRFGGLKERRQVNFERLIPHFPYDHAGTDAGWAWELREREARKHEWAKRPKGKRIEWSTIDLGRGKKGEVGDGWACDWERLLPAPTETAMQKVLEQPDAPFRQLSCRQAAELVEGHGPDSDLSRSLDLFTVKVSMIQRGTPTDCARIYKLPTEPELRSQWLSLMPQPGVRRTSSKQGYRAVDKPTPVQRQRLAQSLLEPPRLEEGPAKAGGENYPIVPDEVHLIGFVTTGNYNLGEGMPTAVANLAVNRVFSLLSKQGVPRAERICIVRQAGSTIGRLARWEVV